MSAVRLGDELTLSGPPRNLRGLIPFTVERATVVPIALNVGVRSSILRAVMRPLVAGTSELRLRLPDQTAPGMYHGEATIDGKARVLIVEIEPQLRIRVQPSETTLSVQAASSEPFSLTIINGGNISIEVPKLAEFDLDDTEVQERALGRSLRAPLREGQPRVERFFEELREGHGGEARVTVRRGAGSLQPGEAREINCALDIPEQVRAERTYSGSFAIGPVSHVIVANIMSSSRQPKVRAVQ